MTDANISSSFIDKPAVGFHVGEAAQEMPPMLSERHRSRSFVTASIDSMVANARRSAIAAQHPNGRKSPQVNQGNQEQFRRFIQQHRPEEDVVPAVAQSLRYNNTALDEVLSQLERMLVVQEEAMQTRVRAFEEQEARAYRHLRAHVTAAIQQTSNQLPANEEDLPAHMDRLRAVAEPSRVQQLLQQGRETSSTPPIRSALRPPRGAPLTPSPVFTALSSGPSSLPGRPFFSDDAVSVTSSLNVEASVTRSERGDESLVGDDETSVVEDVVAESNLSSEGDLTDDELTEEDIDDNDDNAPCPSNPAMDAEMGLSRSVPMHILQPPTQPMTASTTNDGPGPDADAMDLARSVRELSMSIRNGLSDNFSPPTD
eukprot:m.291847 g.291847  ORF g.291847 m.291847 type:complete len:371 (-) comp17820_c0_seq8:4080-5192(-)